VVAHNTLASSDYGLLDENTLTPRPNYWSALLWRRLMGPAVLNPGSSPAPALHLYAHCLRGHPGGVALLAINTGRTASQSLELPTESDRYTLTARNLEDTRVDLNGNELRLSANDELPRLAGVPKTVLERAKEILGNLEESELTPEGKSRRPKPRREVETLKKLAPPPQLDLFG